MDNISFEGKFSIEFGIFEKLLSLNLFSFPFPGLNGASDHLLFLSFLSFFYYIL
jgi:hypothetical protein